MARSHLARVPWGLLGAIWLLRSGEGLKRGALPEVDVVLAARDRQPDWAAEVLRDLPDARLHLYCRGKPPYDPPCIPTEDFGSEEHTFLTHVVRNYGNFAPVTVFVPDGVRTTAKWTAFERIVGRLRGDGVQAFTGFEATQFFPVTGNYDRPQEACAPSERPFGRWYRRFINSTDLDLSHLTCTAAALGNLFAVPSASLLRFPLSYYETLLQEVERCRGRGAAVAGYYLERSWAAMFADRCHSEEAAMNLAEAAMNRERLIASIRRPNLAKDGELAQATTHARTRQASIAKSPSTPLKEGAVSNRTIDLVVASYQAPLGWIEPALAKLPGARLFLYCKGNSTDPRCIHIENLGTEEYAFFVHVLRNYDNLADITIFTKDNMQSLGFYKPTGLDCLNYLVDKLNNTQIRDTYQGFDARLWYPLTPAFDLFKYHKSAVETQVKMLCRPTVSPYGQWYTRFINPDDTMYNHMNCTAASMHGIFSVSKDRIQRIPKSRFSGLIAEVEHCRGQNAFTAGHYMERSWAPLFSDRCRQEEAEENWKNTKAGVTLFWKQFDTVAE